MARVFLSFSFNVTSSDRFEKERIVLHENRQDNVNVLAKFFVVLDKS